MNKNTTHEPPAPLTGYPFSHVKVRSELEEQCPECLSVTIHGSRHYLHRTTAFSLYEQLQEYFQNLSDEEKALMAWFGSNLGEELINPKSNNNP